MATFTVTHHQRLSNVAVVQTLENTDIAGGQSITLSGHGHGLNGTHTVFAVPTYYLVDVDEEGDYIFDSDVIIPNQLLFQDVGDDLERSAADPVGSLVWTQTCTWITVADLTEFLGVPKLERYLPETLSESEIARYLEAGLPELVGRGFFVRTRTSTDQPAHLALAA